MTATDELRRLLDERGVEHYDGTECTYWGGIAPARHDGQFPVYRYSAAEVTDGLSVHLLRVTPEQAVEATLGRGTCRIDLVGYNEREDRFQCRSCNWSVSVKRRTWPRFNYCPNCGAKVIEP